MNQEKINYEQVLSIAEQMKKSATNMEQILNEVKALFNNVGSEGVWAGSAATMAKQKFDQLSAKFPEFYNATSSCYTHLASVVENYKSVDTNVSNS